MSKEVDAMRKMLVVYACDNFAILGEGASPFAPTKVELFNLIQVEQFNNGAARQCCDATY
jgi:hypothetical protein